jgi:hypothetical protein
VGRLVLQAIEKDDFWIFTHPQWNRTLQKQLDAMNDDRSLTKA